MATEFTSPEGDLEKYFVNEYWLIDQYVGDRLFSWGDNSESQHGTGSSSSSLFTLPQEVGLSTITTYPPNSKWKQVSCGGFHNLALQTDSTLWSWGNNQFGQVGFGGVLPSRRTTPTQPVGGNLPLWKDIFAGAQHSLAIRIDRTLWSWGRNNYGQLGLGNINNRSSPTQIGIDTDWITASGSGNHIVAIKSDGTMWSWGRNDVGQLGLGNISNYETSPTQVGIDTDWKLVSSNGNHNLAIKKDGSLWSWGLNNSVVNPPIQGLLGLGDGSADIVTTPTQVGDDYDWKYISCGGFHSAAIKNNYSLWMWGRNDNGQLGVNDTNFRNIPTEVYGQNLLEWKQVSCGDLHTAALNLRGHMFAWGNNSRLQSTKSSPTFITIPTLINNFKNNWKQVSSGFQHSSAVTSGIINSTSYI